MRDLTKFKRGLEQLGVTLDENQIQQFMAYYELLVEKNKVMNLTAITEFDQVVEKHFIDSLMLARVMKLNQKIDVIDMGTGAGFPGIPLKIAFPKLQVTLADSLNKRIKFLQEVIETLKLSGISAIHGRAEDLGRDVLYREKYDLCVSRAVANLVTLSEYCLPFVKVGGCFVSYKSGAVDEEVTQAGKAFRLLGGQLMQCEKMTLPDSEISRSFVVINKITSTKKTYPRKAGKPGKEPLV